MEKRFAVAVFVLALGCSGQEQATADPVGLLGIDEIQVTETASGLEMIGVAERGETIARLDLELGEFFMEDFGEVLFGRRIVVNVLGQEVTHLSAGLGSRRLPLFSLPQQEVLNAFLLDPRVASALVRWDVAFTPPAGDIQPSQPAPEPDAEVEFAGCNPNPPCGPTSCKQKDVVHDMGEGECNWGVEQIVCCPATVANRLCWMESANGCGPEGGGGCATCWSYPHQPGACTTHSQSTGTDECGGNYYTTKDLWANWN